MPGMNSIDILIDQVWDLRKRVADLEAQPSLTLPSGGFTQGSVVFAGASGALAQDNANLFWDDTNNRLGIGTNSPSSELSISRSTSGGIVGAYIKNTAGTAAGTYSHLSLGQTNAETTGLLIRFAHDTDLVTFFNRKTTTGAIDILTTGGGISITNAGHVLPQGAGVQNFGNATFYWADISYKTLTDRGCVPFETEWELDNGRMVKPSEALRAMRGHTSNRTVHGLRRMDYDSVPVVARRPAPIAKEDVYEDDPFDPDEEGRPKRKLKHRRGEKMGEDGVEMTALFGLYQSAMLEMLDRIEALETGQVQTGRDKTRGPVRP